MTKLFAGLSLALLAASLVSTEAAPAKTMHGKMMPAKMVSLYQADKCHMYYTPAQAKKYNYACPDSKGKMKMVKVTAAVAKMQIAKTSAELAPKKTM